MKITICSSMTFFKELQEITKQLEKAGHEVKIPLLRVETEDGKEKISIRDFLESQGGLDNVPADHEIWDNKYNAIDEHFAKVEWADAILVTNYPKNGIDGYVGGNSLMEMGLAHYLRKKIYLLFPVSSKLNYKEEILGMKPTILNGDISLIK